MTSEYLLETPDKMRIVNPYRHEAATDNGVNPGSAHLRGWWECNDASGTITDGHSTANNATAYNTPTYGETGKQGDAIKFVAANSEYARTISNNCGITAYPFTMTVWVKPASIGTASTIMVLSRSSSFSTYWGIGINSSGNFFGVARNTSPLYITGTTVAQAGTWYHVMVTFTGPTNRRIYVNGTLEAGSASETSVSMVSDTDTLVLAALYRSTGDLSHFDGTLDEANLWNIPFLSDERDWIYNDGVGRTLSEATGASASVTLETGIVDMAGTGETGNTHDYTLTGFGTPKAAFGFTGACATVGTVAAHAVFEGNFISGTSGLAWGTYARDASTIIQYRWSETTDYVHSLFDQSGAVKNKSGFNSWIADGFRTDVDSGGSTLFQKHITTLLKGDDLTVAKGTFTANATSGLSTTVSGLGFRPDLILFMCSGMGNATGSHQIYSYGMCDAAENQGAVAIGRLDGDSNINAIAWNNRIGGQLTSSVLSWSAEVTSTTSDGFTVTTRDGGSGSDIIAYMAFRFAGGSAKVVTHDLPGTTGASSVSGAGFTPAFALELFGGAGVWNTLVSTSANEAFMNMSIFDGTNAAGLNMRNDDGVTTVAAKSLMVSQYMKAYNGPGTLVAEVSATPSFTSDGISRNFATNTAAFKAVSAFIQV